MNDTPRCDKAIRRVWYAPASRAIDAIHIDLGRQLERDLNSQCQLAGELIAAIALNHMTKTFSIVTDEQLDEFLKPFRARLLPLSQPERSALGG
jgi:hypothetical protein